MGDKVSTSVALYPLDQPHGSTSHPLLTVDTHLQGGKSLTIDTTGLYLNQGTGSCGENL